MYELKNDQQLREQVKTFLGERKKLNTENRVTIDEIAQSLGIRMDTVEKIVIDLIDNLFDKKRPEPKTPNEISEKLHIVHEDVLGIVDGEQTHQLYLWQNIRYPEMGIVPYKVATPS